MEKEPYYEAYRGIDPWDLPSGPMMDSTPIREFIHEPDEDIKSVFKPIDWDDEKDEEDATPDPLPPDWDYGATPLCELEDDVYPPDPEDEE
jgi:hypothetical protein